MMGAWLFNDLGHVGDEDRGRIGDGVAQGLGFGATAFIDPEGVEVEGGFLVSMPSIGETTPPPSMASSRSGMSSPEATVWP